MYRAIGIHILESLATASSLTSILLGLKTRLKEHNLRRTCLYLPAECAIELLAHAPTAYESRSRSLWGSVYRSCAQRATYAVVPAINALAVLPCFR